MASAHTEVEVADRRAGRTGLRLDFHVSHSWLEGTRQRSKMGFTRPKYSYVVRSDR